MLSIGTITSTRVLTALKSPIWNPHVEDDSREKPRQFWETTGTSLMIPFCFKMSIN